LVNEPLNPRFFLKNHSINSTKGALILLVILGHLIQGKFTESLPRFLIYGFHMPLFMAVSGYLFSNNYHKITTRSWLKKIASRALLPWFLAVLIFALFLNKVGYYQLSLPALFVESLLRPFYHLWFIPAWIVYQGILRISQKYKLNKHRVLWISAGICWLFTSEQTAIHFTNFSPFSEIFNILRPQFFVFFVLGYYIKTSPEIVPTNLQRSFEKPVHAAVSILLFIGFYFFRNECPQWTDLYPHLYLVLYFYLNLSLVFLMFNHIKNDSLPRNPFLEWFGVQSLLVYLWHPLGILFAKYLISYQPTHIFYMSATSSTLSILIIIYFYDKIRNA